MRKGYLILGKSNSPFREFLEASLYNPSFTFMDG